MQVVVYADVLIMLNAIITYILLLTTTEVVGVSGERIRYFFGSFVGGIFSLIIIAPEMNIFLSFFVKCIICVLIVIITYKIPSVRILLKCICGFIAVSFLYGGVMYLLSDKMSASRIYYNNGYAYYELSSIALVVLCVVIFVTVKLLSKKVFSKSSKDYLYEIEIKIRDKEKMITAFYDTGNSVADVFTGKPVIIVAFEAIKDCFSEEEIQMLEVIMNEGIIEFLPDKVRLIPICTLGNMKMLPAFTAEKTIIRNNDDVKILYEPTIAVSDKIFNDKKFSALLNDAVLGRV